MIQIKKHKWCFTGCLVQFAALLIIPAGYPFSKGLGLILTIPLGVALWIIGKQRGDYYACSNCGNRLADGSVRMCPVCKSTPDDD